MAFELYGMLAGNVSPRTGENVMPAYGGEEEVFLRKVVTPIYDVIRRVFDYDSMFQLIIAKYLYFAILTMFNAVTYTLHRKLKVAKKENQNIRSGETTMI